MSDINALFEMLSVIKKIKGLTENAINAAEHDIIYFNLDTNDIHPESGVGKQLDKLGFHIDSDVKCWALFV